MATRGTTHSLLLGVKHWAPLCFPAEFTIPRAILTGHDCEVTCASVCAELGLVISGCKGKTSRKYVEMHRGRAPIAASHPCVEGPCLIHSMNGDLLRTLEGPEKCTSPRLIQSSTEGHCMIYYDRGQFCLFSVNGKLLRHLELEDSVKVSAPKCIRTGIPLVDSRPARGCTSERRRPASR